MRKYFINSKQVVEVSIYDVFCASEVNPCQYVVEIDTENKIITVCKTCKKELAESKYEKIKYNLLSQDFFTIEVD